MIKINLLFVDFKVFFKSKFSSGFHYNSGLQSQPWNWAVHWVLATGQLVPIGSSPMRLLRRFRGWSLLRLRRPRRKLCHFGREGHWIQTSHCHQSPHWCSLCQQPEQQQQAACQVLPPDCQKVAILSWVFKDSLVVGKELTNFFIRKTRYFRRQKVKNRYFGRQNKVKNRF